MKELEFCNITKWHEKGYTGKGITIWSCEDDADHGADIKKVLQLVAPDANIICKSHHSLGLSISDGEITSGKDKVDKYFDEIINSGTSIMTDSCASGFEKLRYVKEKYRNLLQPHGIISFVAAGNHGIKGLQDEAKQEEYIAVGSVRLDQNSNIVRSDFSAVGAELDIMGIGEVISLRGTSFASPFDAAMLALYHQYFKETLGRLPSYAESKNFIYDNCIDLQDKGFDIYTGQGLFILPEEVSDMKIELEIGKKEITVDGITKKIDVAPIVVDGRTLVPLRVISEALGCKIDYMNNKIIITR